jgi:hypothetical protein
MGEIMNVTVTDTIGLIHLAENAKGRNRSVYEDKLAMDVDPSGTHVLALKFPHNDIEWRTQWLCKMRGTDVPATIWLDVDFDVFSLLTQEMEVADQND